MDWSTIQVVIYWASKLYDIHVYHSNNAIEIQD